MSAEHIELGISIILAIAGLITAIGLVVKYVLPARKGKSEEQLDVSAAKKNRAEANGIDTSSLISIVNALNLRVEAADAEAVRLRDTVGVLRTDLEKLQQHAIDIEAIHEDERANFEKIIIGLRAEISQLKKRIKELEAGEHPKHA
jgi:predicted  nucleic acid-binding Zn-ribbon protein